MSYQLIYLQLSNKKTIQFTDTKQNINSPFSNKARKEDLTYDCENKLSFLVNNGVDLLVILRNQFGKQID